MNTDPRPTVYIETYGCQMNVSDTELMLGKLTASGYESVEKPDGADVILINTCAIRDHAEQRVIGRLGELKSKMKREAVLGVTGCMAQRLGPKLLDKAKHVSLVIGPDGYRALPQLVDGARHGERAIATSFDLEEHYEDFSPRRFDKVKAWIPVQRGCDYRCTYCIVPTTRGSERSRRLEDVVRETAAVVDEGMTE
ncbi:MAG: radical SAM protein, partial [Gemmatimonadaceae bacterium]